MGDDWIEYGERIRSPWEAKFWAYYWRREMLSQVFIKVRRSHYNRVMDISDLNEFYARADDFISKAQFDIEHIMKGVKTGKPPADFLIALKGLMNSKQRDADKAQRIMELINQFAAKSGLDGQTEKFFKKPWDRTRQDLGVRGKGGNSNED